jgi:hypothetical protein
MSKLIRIRIFVFLVMLVMLSLMPGVSRSFIQAKPLVLPNLQLLSETPTDTATNTPVTPSETPSDTPTNTPVTPSETPSDTPTNTPVTPSETPTDTATNTPITPSETPTDTATNTPVTPSETPSNTPTNTPEPTNTPSETLFPSPTFTDFFDVFATLSVTPPPSNTPTPTNTPTFTPTPVLHDVAITAFFMPIHNPDRTGALPLRLNQMRNLIAIVNVESHSSHFNESDTVNVRLTLTGTATTCGAVLGDPNQQITLNPGQSKPVVFHLTVQCRAVGAIPNAISLRADATHIGAPDANPADNVATYSLNVTVP